MNIVFVYSNDYSFGIGILCAVLKAQGHTVSVVPSRYSWYEMELLAAGERYGGPARASRVRQALTADRHAVIHDVLDRKPEVIGFSATTDFYPWNLEVARGLKSCADVFTIFGGAHPTFLPEKVISQEAVDAVCVGEAELALPAFLTRVMEGLDGRPCPNFWYKSGGSVVRGGLMPLIEDLDSLPFQDWQELTRGMPRFRGSYGVITSRGCPFSCSYCASSAFRRLYSGLGCYLRRRTPASVMAEIRQAVARETIKSLGFVDDVFTLDKKWLAEFLPLYRKEFGIPYRCLIHPEAVDEDTVKLLAETGCFAVKLGIQSVNEHILRDIIHRHQSLEKIRQIAEWAHRYELEIVVDIILGFPDESEKDVLDALEYCSSLRPAGVYQYYLKYYPGTDILRQVRERGLITEADLALIEDGMEASYFDLPRLFSASQQAMYGPYGTLFHNVTMLSPKIVRIARALRLIRSLGWFLTWREHRWRNRSIDKLLSQ
jgi:radical SAM superfamily enzyme YgiQ (UPF0313 family)